MRKFGRTDRTQAAIVQALREAGVSVAVISMVGLGRPDLICGYLDRKGEARNLLLEVKAGKGKETPEQIKFRGSWIGPLQLVRTVEDALRACEKVR